MVADHRGGRCRGGSFGPGTQRQFCSSTHRASGPGALRLHVAGGRIADFQLVDRAHAGGCCVGTRSTGKGRGVRPRRSSRAVRLSAQVPCPGLCGQPQWRLRFDGGGQLDPSHGAVGLRRIGAVRGAETVGPCPGHRRLPRCADGPRPSADHGLSGHRQQQRRDARGGERRGRGHRGNASRNRYRGVRRRLHGGGRQGPRPHSGLESR